MVEANYKLRSESWVLPGRRFLDVGLEASADGVRAGSDICWVLLVSSFDASGDFFSLSGPQSNRQKDYLHVT